MLRIESVAEALTHGWVLSHRTWVRRTDAAEVEGYLCASKIDWYEAIDGFGDRVIEIDADGLGGRS